MAAVPLPSAGYFNGAITNAQAKNAQDAVLAFLRQSIPGGAAIGTFTIASDGVTPDGSSASFTVDTESGAATDNLSTIVQTNTTNGQIILVSQVSDSRIVTVKHGIGGSGQILLRGDVDMNLNTEVYLWLQRQGTNWVEVMRTGSSPLTVNAGTAGGTANALTGTPNLSFPAYRTDMVITVVATAANTSGTVTLNLLGLGNKNIKKIIGAGKVGLGIGDIQPGPLHLYYDGTDLVWLNAPTYSHGADIASTSTVNLNSATGDCVDITGTTTITAMTLNEGVERTLRFTGALILTHGSSLIIPGAANVTTAAGDFAIVRGYASGVVRVLSFTKASGKPIAALSVSELTSGTIASGVGSNETPYGYGTISTGTVTPAPQSHGHKPYYTNGGAHTLAAPAAACSLTVEITNNGSAGAITLSGFTKSTGDAFTTTNGDKFICAIEKTQNYALISVIKL